MARNTNGKGVIVADMGSVLRQGGQEDTKSWFRVLLSNGQRRQIKLIAALSDKSMQEFMVEALEKHLKDTVKTLKKEHGDDVSFGKVFDELMGIVD